MSRAVDTVTDGTFIGGGHTVIGGGHTVRIDREARTIIGKNPRDALTFTDVPSDPPVSGAGVIGEKSLSSLEDLTYNQGSKTRLKAIGLIVAFALGVGVITAAMLYKQGIINIVGHQPMKVVWATALAVGSAAEVAVATTAIMMLIQQRRKSAHYTRFDSVRASQLGLKAAPDSSVVDTVYGRSRPSVYSGVRIIPSDFHGKPA